jgi:DNA repair exonuclease SbcCD ATPase subunit
MGRKDNSPPLSLFSFQDIITGLCGIMILLVLIMVLDLITKPDVKPTEKGPDEEVNIDKLRADVEALKKQYNENERGLAERVPETNVLTELAIKTKDANQQDAAIRNLDTQVPKLKEQLANLKQEKEESDRKYKELENVRKALDAAIAQIPAKSEMTIILERGQSKMPIYVECSQKTVTVHFPIHKKEPIIFTLSQATAQLLKLANETDKLTNYFVFLIRPSSVKYAFDLQSAIKSLGFATGQDPVLEDKVVKFSIK